jgi:ribosome-binding factor A
MNALFDGNATFSESKTTESSHQPRSRRKKLLNSDLRNMSEKTKLVDYTELVTAELKKALKGKESDRVISKIRDTLQEALQEHRIMCKRIEALEVRVVELTTDTVTARMRLDGKDDEKQAIEEIIKHLNAGTLKEYIPNRGRTTEAIRAKNNPHQYIRDNVVPILKTIGLENLAYKPVIYRRTLPAFYNALNTYTSVKKRENLIKEKTQKPRSKRKFICYEGDGARI